jgi:hypothetical protein
MASFVFRWVLHEFIADSLCAALLKVSIWGFVSDDDCAGKEKPQLRGFLTSCAGLKARAALLAT